MKDVGDQSPWLGLLSDTGDGNFRETRMQQLGQFSFADRMRDQGKVRTPGMFASKFPAHPQLQLCRDEVPLYPASMTPCC